LKVGEDAGRVELGMRLGAQDAAVAWDAQQSSSTKDVSSGVDAGQGQLGAEIIRVSSADI